MLTSYHIAGLWIGVGAPFIGLVIYGILVRLMLVKEIPTPPIAEFFWLFVFYGGGLLAILTEFYWQWSLGPEIGLFVLIFIAPFYLWFQAYRIRKLVKESIFHRLAFIFSACYPLFLIIVGIIVTRNM